MITLELTEEDIGTLIDALGTWMELPEECEGEEWLRRQSAGADLDMELREAFNRRNDWGDQDDHPEQAQASREAAWEEEFIQAGIDAREQIKETSRAATRREAQIAEAINDGDDLPLSNDPVDW